MKLSSKEIAELTVARKAMNPNTPADTGRQAVKLTDQQWRVIELLAREPRPNIFFDSRERWRACVTPSEFFERMEVAPLFASGLIETHFPTVIARSHLRLTTLGQRLASQRFSDGEG